MYSFTYTHSLTYIQVNTHTYLQIHTHTHMHTVPTIARAIVNKKIRGLFHQRAKLFRKP